jgi:hypothetical protein
MPDHSKQPSSGELSIFQMQLAVMNEIKDEVKGARRDVETIKVDMARGDGRMSRIEDRLERVEGDLREIKERDTENHAALCPREDCPRAEEEGKQDQISVSGTVKVIGAIAAGAAVVIGAYFAGGGGKADPPASSRAVPAAAHHIPADEAP